MKMEELVSEGVRGFFFIFGFVIYIIFAYFGRRENLVGCVCRVGCSLFKDNKEI